MVAPGLKIDMNSILRFDTREQLVEQLGNSIAEHLRTAIASRGSATLAVSGGNSPKLLFNYLSQQKLDWQHVTITLVDERWVNANHPDSNAKLVRDYLLQHEAKSATFIPLYNCENSPFSAEPAINQALAKLQLPFDSVVLGMGDDGHTASFFPGAKTLNKAIDMKNPSLCCAIEPLTAPHARMTLTLPALLNSRSLYLLVTGSSKLPVLQRALENFNRERTRDSWLAELPVRTVLYQDQIPISVYYAD